MTLNIDRLDAHDRLEHYKKQDFDIEACCQDLLDKRPFGDYPFYMFAHFRTDDDGITKRLIWQPRLTKPFAQTNSMLFKGYPGTDIIKIIWIIPARELWPNFQAGQMTENKIISESIHDFEHNRSKLEAKEDDDLSDETIDRIYLDMAKSARHEYKKI